MAMGERIEDRLQSIHQQRIVLNRRYLDDEQLERHEQFKVLDAIFDVDVRNKEIGELTSHFAPVLGGDHPVHLSLHGKTGTGKTVTMLYFLHILKGLCRKKNIPLVHVHLDLPTPSPSFRVLNDLACLLDAARRYKRGVSLDELMGRIEDRLGSYKGYLILFIDEIDHVRRDSDSFLKFLIRRLPQRIPVKLILIFSSNRLNWQETLDPRIKSFLKVNELLFEPYNAVDLKRILSIRVEKGLNPKMIEEGVVDKIAAVSSTTHGDARKAVELLRKSAEMAEKNGSTITIDTVDKALSEIEKDTYVAMIKSAPRQLQAALFSIISHPSFFSKKLNTTECYVQYRRFCTKVKLRGLTQRAFSDLVSELDIYGFIQSRIIYKGRYGRCREISGILPPQVAQRLKQTLLLAFDLETR